MINFYLQETVRPFSPDPSSVEIRITDGKGDGGLDAFAIDPDFRRVVLVQAKWFDKEGTALSQSDSLELLNFYRIRYVGKSMEKLNDGVKSFLRRAWAEFANWDVDLVYLTNGTFDEPAKREHEAEVAKGDVSFSIIGEPELCSGFIRALSQEEPINNQAILSLSQAHQFTTIVPDPRNKTSPQHMRVLFMLAGAPDLKRAYGRISERLFIRNLRYGKGKTKANEEMKQTAETSDRVLFPMLHNGVSLVAENFSIVPVPLKHGTSELDEIALRASIPEIDPDELTYAAALAKSGVRDLVWLHNFQVVNGAQSTVTLSDIDDQLLPEIFLPCKISETASRELAQMVARCNNTQNAITPVDLIANEPQQMLLQTYGATQLSPPIFYQRKSGEKWVSILRAAGPAPDSIRQLKFEQVYQAFLAFSGHPGEAYSRLRASVYPNTPGYDQINREPDRELVLLMGLIANYEKASRTTRPEFTNFWAQWAIAAFGHVYRRHLNDQDRKRLRTKLLSASGLGTWKRIRKNLVKLYEVMFSEFFNGRVTDYQDFFKNIEDPTAFGLRGYTKVKAADAAPYVHPSLQTKSDLLSMKEGQRKTGLDIGYYDVNFAVVAVIIDRILRSNDEIAKAIAKG